MNLHEYYKSPDVRARMMEFLGGESPAHPSSAYISRCDTLAGNEIGARPVRDLRDFLERDLDVARSLWDHTSLLAHIDVEYVNLQSPTTVYTHPEHGFRSQAPAIDALRFLLGSFGIVPLHLLSGRGHHFVWSVSRSSRAFSRLAHEGRLPDHLRLRYAEPLLPERKSIDSELGAAFSGLGLVMEYLADRVQLAVGLDSPLPVELAADAEAGTGGPLELVSIDVTEYGDPLDTRRIRIPFSV